MIGVDVCDRCGFVRAEWNEQDAKRTIALADELLSLWIADAEGELDRKLQERRIDDLKAIAAADDLVDEVHHLMHGLVSIADVRRAAHDAVPTQRGVVTHLHRSAGGLPKTAIETATVGRRGVDGDVQATRAHHGRPWQALCLWSAEVIDALAADGHPISPGAAGENVTISGIDWSTLRAGTIIELGSGGGSGDGAVRCQLSSPAAPCSKTARWFSDGDFSRLEHDLHPERVRWYASVVRTGEISAGDEVVVSPR